MPQQAGQQVFDLVVVGGGPGGYPAAIRASQLGLKTALVEKERPGGVCLNWGCIPTKAMLRSAEVLETMRHSAEDGVLAENVRLDYSAVLKRKDRVVKTLTDGVASLLEANGVTVVNGHARLVGATAVEVVGVGDAPLGRRRAPVQRTAGRRWPAAGQTRGAQPDPGHRLDAGAAADPGDRPARRRHLGRRVPAGRGAAADRGHRGQRGRRRMGDHVPRLRLGRDHGGAHADAGPGRGRGHRQGPGPLVHQAGNQGPDRPDGLGDHPGRGEEARRTAAGHGRRPGRREPPAGRGRRRPGRGRPPAQHRRAGPAAGRGDHRPAWLGAGRRPAPDQRARRVRHRGRDRQAAAGRRGQPPGAGRRRGDRRPRRADGLQRGPGGDLHPPRGGQRRADRGQCQSGRPRRGRRSLPLLGAGPGPRPTGRPRGWSRWSPDDATARCSGSTSSARAPAT
jgi:Pyridine nucleotide-disulphide oxidoreductase